MSLPLLTNTIGPPAMVMSVMTMHAGNLSATATKLFIHSSASLGDLALISLTISSNFEFRPGNTEKSENWWVMNKKRERQLEEISSEKLTKGQEIKKRSNR